MRIAKGALYGLMSLCLVVGWINRDSVLSAYGDQENAITLDVRLTGLSSGVERTELGSSPYIRTKSTDLAHQSIGFEPLQPTEEPEPAVVEIVKEDEGEATLRGLVTGPDGPAPGARIKLERVTADGTAELEVTANQKGEWEQDELLGGRYRVRAWFSPNLWMESSNIFFMPGDEEKELNFALKEVSDKPIIEFHGRDEVEMGSQFTVVVSAGRKSVDEEGRLVAAPIAGVPVRIADRGRMDLLSASTVSTDGSGAASFALRCRRTGASSGAFMVAPIADSQAEQKKRERQNGRIQTEDDQQVAEKPQPQRVSYALPTCVSPPPTTTTTTEKPATDSTNKKNSSASTKANTTTTQKANTTTTQKANTTTTQKANTTNTAKKEDPNG